MKKYRNSKFLNLFIIWVFFSPQSGKAFELKNLSFSATDVSSHSQEKNIQINKSAAGYDFLKNDSQTFVLDLSCGVKN